MSVLDETGLSAALGEPVLSLADLEAAGGSPVPVRWRGEAWLIVRLGEQLAALRDLCPHRRVPLSAGRVHAGASEAGPGLQCAYHGWVFAADGRCSHIPALGEAAVPRGMRVAAAEVILSGGLLYLRDAS